jgi:uncharacterized protein YecT (DUF1311 family)
MIIIAISGIAGCGSTKPANKKDSAVPAITVPVIEETISGGACPASPTKRRTTYGELICYSNLILRSDDQINMTVKKIFNLIRGREIRLRFTTGERMWIRYRRISCEAQANLYKGGSEEPIMYRSCIVEKNRTHLEELRPFLKYLEEIHGR